MVLDKMSCSGYLDGDVIHLGGTVLEFGCSKGIGFLPTVVCSPN